jgi:cell division protein FtsL
MSTRLRAGSPAYKGNISSRPRLRFWSLPVFSFIIGLAGIVAVAYPFIGNYSKKLWLDQEIAKAQSDISEYEKQNQDLKEMINYLSSDQAVEEKARLSLGLKRAGEQVVVIQEKGLSANSSALPEPVPAIMTNSEKWFDYFFN